MHYPWPSIMPEPRKIYPISSLSPSRRPISHLEARVDGCDRMPSANLVVRRAANADTEASLTSPFSRLCPVSLGFYDHDRYCSLFFEILCWFLPVLEWMTMAATKRTTTLLAAVLALSSVVAHPDYHHLRTQNIIEPANISGMCLGPDSGYNMLICYHFSVL